MRDVLLAQLADPAGMQAPAQPAAASPHKVSGGKREDPARLREAAKEFEALFLSYMLKVMRESIGESGLVEGGLGQDIYTELFDQELARSLAGNGALGIADLLMRKLADSEPTVIPDPQPLTAPAAPANAGHDSGKSSAGEIPDFRMPVQAHLSSAFGSRQDPFTYKTSHHRGVDLAAPSGMNVRAACAGRVTFSGFEQGYGNTVVVQHPGGFETRYAHMGVLLAKTGDTLQGGQVLGTVGSTGRSTGPHLHFEVSRHGVKLNPATLLGD